MRKHNFMVLAMVHGPWQHCQGGFSLDRGFLLTGFARLLPSVTAVQVCDARMPGSDMLPPKKISVATGLS